MRKVVHAKVLSFLSYKWATPLILLLAFITLNNFFFAIYYYLPNVFSKREEIQANNTISGESFDDILCPDSIDIVYTWVNGSDPLHIKALKDVKKKANKNFINLPKCNSTLKENCFKDDDSQNRYIDNYELLYSLRSVEKFAPWIRNIYLVTNGQIPYWLNLKRPNLHVITHEQIFLNKSHLPTFSSPSIETHLHRIPGLSKHFIYLNDDVMFGNTVWPDDFYSVSRGQRVHLTWAVPDCSPGCMSSWIKDGHCDLSCNNTNCDFDGGDCDNVTASSANNWWYGSPSTKTGNTANYCSKQCPDSWIGDRFCDKSCKIPECGMDSGDCGVDLVFSQLKGYDIKNLYSNYSLTTKLPAVYFNLSSIIPQSYEISDANHNNNNKIRTAIVNQKLKFIIFTLLNKNESTQHVSITINANKKEHKSEKLNVTIDLIFPGSVKSSNKSLSNTTISNTNTTILNINTTRNVTFSSRKLKDFVYTEEQFLDFEDELFEDNLFEDIKVKSFAKGRTLLDNYGDSLRFVDRLLNKKFGSEPRKVPAHMPLYFVKNIIEEMQQEWAEHFERTSASSLRSSKDMQFAFSYDYFMMNARVPFDFDDVFNNELDIDKDGMLSETELRSLIARLNSGHLENTQYDEFKDQIFYKCDNETTKIRSNSTSPQSFGKLNNTSFGQNNTLEINSNLNLTQNININQTAAKANRTKELELKEKEKKKKLEESWAKIKLTKVHIKTCETAYQKIKEFFSLRRKYKFEIVNNDQVGFLMVGTKSDTVKKGLDILRNRRPKFLCLNDDMNHTDPNSIEIREQLQEFYKSIVPHPSSFELPEGIVNENQYINPPITEEEDKVEDEPSSTPKYVIIIIILVLIGFFLKKYLESDPQHQKKKYINILPLN